MHFDVALGREVDPGVLEAPTSAGGLGGEHRDEDPGVVGLAGHPQAGAQVLDEVAPRHRDLALGLLAGVGRADRDPSVAHQDLARLERRDVDGGLAGDARRYALEARADVEALGAHRRQAQPAGAQVDAHREVVDRSMRRDRRAEAAAEVGQPQRDGVEIADPDRELGGVDDGRAGGRAAPQITADLGPQAVEPECGAERGAVRRGLQVERERARARGARHRQRPARAEVELALQRLEARQTAVQHEGDVPRGRGAEDGRGIEAGAGSAHRGRRQICGRGRADHQRRTGQLAAHARMPGVLVAAATRVEVELGAADELRQLRQLLDQLRVDDGAGAGLELAGGEAQVEVSAAHGGPGVCVEGEVAHLDDGIADHRSPRQADTIDAQRARRRAVLDPRARHRSGVDVDGPRLGVGIGRGRRRGAGLHQGGQVERTVGRDRHEDVGAVDVHTIDLHGLAQQRQRRQLDLDATDHHRFATLRVGHGDVADGRAGGPQPLDLADVDLAHQEVVEEGLRLLTHEVSTRRGPQQQQDRAGDQHEQRQQSQQDPLRPAQHQKASPRLRWMANSSPASGSVGPVRLMRRPKSKRTGPTGVS
jgi:hypothetical protein